MSWDLGISENGDLVLAGNRDLSGKSGTDLLEQRMIIRLKLPQGEWVYDESGQMGSTLRQLYGMAPERASLLAPALVRQALRAMNDEITVDDVNVFSDDQAIQMLILYRVLESSPEAMADDEQERQLQVSLPLTGGV